MKYFVIVLIALVAVCYADEAEERTKRIKAAAGACLESEGVSKEAAEKLKQGNFSNADQKTKCFANCFLEKLGLIVNGQPQENVIREKLGAIVGKDKINEVIQQCNGARGADNCATAFKLYECYYKNNAVKF